MKKIVFFLILMMACGYLNAQELNARVQVLAPNVANINRNNLELLQTTIRNFLNNSNVFVVT